MNVTVITLSPEQLEEMISQAVQKHAFTGPHESTYVHEYISIEQAMEKYKMKRSHLYRLSSDCIISTRKVGKTIQFNVKELDDFVNSKIKRSITAIKADLGHNPFPALGARHRKKTG